MAATRTRSAKRQFLMQCPNCGSGDIATQDQLELTSFKRDEVAWVVKGAVKIQYCVHGECRNCGMVFDLIPKQIPLAVPSLECPKCHQTRYLICEVTELELLPTRTAFTFAGLVKCENCGKQKSFRRLLRNLFNKVSIEVGLGGVSIKSK